MALLKGGNMLLASRIWVALIGLLSLLTVIPHWFRLEGLVAERGIQAIGLIGRANIRADVGGLFLAIGALAIIAAYGRNTTWLAAAMLVSASAFFGRLISLMVDGYGPLVLEPMIIELVAMAAFAAAYRVWKKVPEGL